MAAPNIEKLTLRAKIEGEGDFKKFSNLKQTRISSQNK